MLKLWDELEKIIEVGIESGKIKSYFSKGLNFIIWQKTL